MEMETQTGLAHPTPGVSSTFFYSLQTIRDLDEPFLDYITRKKNSPIDRYIINIGQHFVL